ncbi:MAG: Nucleoside diphosphate kinase [Microgenomates group bacterium GW2011_GWF2_45_18]|nr:MAG: Nucleoside diphosphate kinase [Microgenomates group bacterium GW2011_GWF1_44_10]KKU01339.1 MAG: Nucleoside diphosphate kinase [Microgenomates group bacterium GW2011_GWF2_45_18]HAU99351.1 nucleoside-diphosphate kinase [Candidatus Paceibacterota bacterium]HAX01935.1 nucleoside-diphosphate kinase [Candidatus Paceibacterota bacterium]
MQQSVVLVKPDGLQRGLIGEIIGRFERKGLKLVGLKMVGLDDDVLDRWYAHHKEKPFFGGLKSFMKQTPIVAMVWEGLDAVSTIRKLVGVTKGREAEGGSIRGDFAMSQSNNLIHASDSEENAQKERKMVFEDDEIYSYVSGLDTLVYSSEERE